MEEVLKYIKEGHKAVINILNCIEEYKIEIPVMLELENTIELFVYMKGFMAGLIQCPNCQCENKVKKETQ